MYADVLKRKAIKLDMNIAVTVSVMLLINHLQLYLYLMSKLVTHSFY